MTKCDICNKLLTKRVPGLECSRCSKVVHASQACAGLSAKQISALRNSESIEWSCEECHRNSPLKRSSFIIPDEEEEEQGIMESDVDVGSCSLDANKFLKEIKKLLKKELQPIEISISSCIHKLEFLTKTVESQNVQIKELQKSNSEMRVEKAHLKVKIVILEQQVRNIEQQRLDNVLEVSGIPKTQNENLSEIFTKVSETLCVDSNQIKIIKRKDKRNGHDGNILVELKKPELAVGWIRASKKIPILVEQITRDIPTALAKSAVIVRQALTKSNKALLWQARQKLKPAYKYVWFQDGNVLVRRGDSDKPVVIRGEEDITDIASLSDNKNTGS